MNENLENGFGEESQTVEVAAAEVFDNIDQLDAQSKEEALAVFDGVSEDSTAMFAGWMDNINKRAFPIESLRKQFDLVAQEFARDRDITGDENPNKEKHLKSLATQSAFGLRKTAVGLGLDIQLLDEVVPHEDLEQ